VVTDAENIANTKIVAAAIENHAPAEVAKVATAQAVGRVTPHATTAIKCNRKQINSFQALGGDFKGLECTFQSFSS
jgi:hypothetical protein